MFIVNETLPLVIRMSPNPNSISIDRVKVYSQTQTIGGWVYEHWGEKPRTLKVKGRTLPVLDGAKLGTNSDLGVEAVLFGLQQIFALDKRRMVDTLGSVVDQTKRFLTKDVLTNPNTAKSTESIKVLSNTFIYYKFDLYNGFFTDFSFRQDAETMPRHYEYEFTFMVTSTAQSSLVDNIFMSTAAGTAAAGLLGSVQTAMSGNAVVGAALVGGAKIIKSFSPGLLG